VFLFAFVKLDRPSGWFATEKNSKLAVLLRNADSRL